MALKRYFFLLVFVVSSLILSANGGIFGWKGTSGTVFHMSLGSQSVDLDLLNDEISLFYGVSYPNDFASISAQYMYISDNLVLGVEGKHLYNGNHSVVLTPNADPFHMHVDGTAGFFDLGYVLYTNRFTFITPWIGLGMGNVNFSLIPDAIDIDPDDMDILEILPKTLSINSTSTMMNLGICMDFISRTWSIGGSLGYMFPLSDSDWQLAGEKIESSPSTSLRGAYFNITIGYTQLELWSNYVN